MALYCSYYYWLHFDPRYRYLCPPAGLLGGQGRFECAEKLICFLASSESLTPQEKSIVELLQFRRDALASANPGATAPEAAQAITAAKALGRSGGECAAIYNACPLSRDQLYLMAARRAAGVAQRGLP